LTGARHSGESRNPVFSRELRIVAFAAMTAKTTGRSLAFNIFNNNTLDFFV